MTLEHRHLLGYVLVVVFFLGPFALIRWIEHRRFMRAVRRHSPLRSTRRDGKRAALAVAQANVGRTLKWKKGRSVREEMERVEAGVQARRRQSRERQTREG